MKDQSRELYAAALLGDLLIALGKRDKIRTMLQDLNGVPSDALIRELLDAFEKIVEQRRLEHLAGMGLGAGTGDDTVPGWDIHLTPPKAINTEPPPEAVVAEQPPTMSAEPPPRIEKPAAQPSAPLREQPSHAAARRPKDAPPPVVLPKEPLPPLTQVSQPEKELQLPAEPAVPAQPVAQSRVPSEFNEEDTVYLHGVRRLTAEEESPFPFMMEEKGIENRSFVFAYDHRGLRFYMSRLKPDSMSVSKNGMLLLGKAESLRLRGVHEGMLNDLRAHGVLLPFEFGTVVRGRSELAERIENNYIEIMDGLDELQQTSWWNLSVYVLDSRMAEFVQTDGSMARREPEQARKSFTLPTHAKRLDIKILERILTRQKKIAESIHGELSNISDRSDIDMMIGFGSGTSEDWKLILKASYEVPASRLQTFNRAVTDLQYQHFLLDLMLCLSGKRESFSFR